MSTKRLDQAMLGVPCHGPQRCRAWQQQASCWLQRLCGAQPGGKPQTCRASAICKLMLSLHCLLGAPVADAAKGHCQHSVCMPCASDILMARSCYSTQICCRLHLLACCSYACPCGFHCTQLTSSTEHAMQVKACEAAQLCSDVHSHSCMQASRGRGCSGRALGCAHSARQQQHTSGDRAAAPSQPRTG